MTSLTDKGPTAERVVVVGPVITDRYYLGKSDRVDQTAAVPIVDVAPDGSFASLGGAANAARCLASLAMPVAFISAVGDDPAGRAFMDTELPMITRYVKVAPGYQTPVKNRVYSTGNLVARFDIDESPKVNVEDYIIDMFQRCVDDSKPLAILISDYAKGICTERTLTHIMAYAKANDVKVVVDPTPLHMQFYRGAHIVTPNAAECMVATGLETVGRSAAVICTELEVASVVVTCGADGLFISTGPDDPPETMPAVPALPVDTCGAGDVIAATLAYGTAVDIPPTAMYHMAVAAGAICVEFGGAGPVSLHQIHKRIATVFGAERKLVNADFTTLLRMSVAIDGTKFGVTNGIFDVLHPGHVSMLRQAREACDFLVVLLNTDSSAEGIGRKPVMPLTSRASQLAALPCVDAVMAFDGATPEPEIARLLPDVLIKGPELKGKEKEIPGYDVVVDNGGTIVIATLEHDTHGTTIKEKVIESEARQEGEA